VTDDRGRILAALRDRLGAGTDVRLSYEPTCPVPPALVLDTPRVLPVYQADGELLYEDIRQELIALASGRESLFALMDAADGTMAALGYGVRARDRAGGPPYTVRTEYGASVINGACCPAPPDQGAQGAVDF